jgi:aspartate/methionine/tyrosine aminotransferase
MAIDPIDPTRTAPRIARVQLPEYRPLLGMSVGEGERELERLTRGAGRPLLNLTYADTHRFPAPPWAIEQLVEAAAGRGPSYTAYRGDGEVRAAVAGSVGAFLGFEVDPERELILTPGSQAALSTALLALVEEGDRVVLPDPDYISSERLVRLAGGAVNRISLLHAGASGRLDPEEVAAAVGRDTRAILFSNPNNPTGAVYDLATLEAVAEIARERDLFVIADELYSRLVYDGREFVHIAALEGMRERTITLLGPSKTESMSGFRLGVAVGPAATVTAMEDLLGLTVLRAPAYAQWALVPWLRDDQSFVAERIQEYQALRDATVSAFKPLDFAELDLPGGTAYAFPSVAALGISDQDVAAALIEEAGVIVNPGYQFGRRGIGSFRICFAQEEAVWDDALSRISTTLRGLAG